MAAETWKGDQTMAPLTVWLFSGYSRKNPKTDFKKLRKAIRSKGMTTKTIDYLKRIRKGSLFPITRKKMDDIKVQECCFNTMDLKNTIAICWSYGIIGLLKGLRKKKSFPKKIILVCPVFGPGTIRWRWYEKLILYIPGFPGFRELESSFFWQVQCSFLDWIKSEGTEIIFFVPPRNEDGKVLYKSEVIEKMKEFGKVKTLPVDGHRAAIQSLKNINEIISVL